MCSHCKLLHPKHENFLHNRQLRLTPSNAAQDMDRYGFRPRELLHSIMRVYLQLARADRKGVFARAIAEDARSYTPEMFPEAARVGWR